jgi:hypothetical protein
MERAESVRKLTAAVHADYRAEREACEVKYQALRQSAYDQRRRLIAGEGDGAMSTSAPLSGRLCNDRFNSFCQS